MDINSIEHCKKFGELFKKKIYEIDSDEPTLMKYLDPYYCYQILIPYGICRNIHSTQYRKFNEFRINKKIMFNVTRNNTKKYEEYYTARKTT